MNWQTLITALIGSTLMTALVQIAQAFLGRGKQKADTDDTTAGTAVRTAKELLEPLRLELGTERAERMRLEEQMDAQRLTSRADKRQFEDELDRVNGRVRELERQVAELERQVAERDATIIQLRSSNGYLG